MTERDRAEAKPAKQRQSTEIRERDRVSAEAPAQARRWTHPLPAKARTPQPSEPILIPKLRIQFADFPYLHYSIDQRLLTLETCCGYGYELVRVRRNLPGIFKVPPGTRGCRENCGTLRHSQNPFSLREDSRASAAYAEKTTLPRAPVGVSQSCRVTTTDTRVRTVPLPGTGI